MKKTFTINISGSVFHIDEDAYEKLQKYLQMLSSHFGTNAEGREILQDIEARIAELFNDKKQSEEKDVIIEIWIDDVIERMGKPEDFLEGEEDEEQEVTEEKATTTTDKIKRRMYRDPDSRVLGGVCGGMGAYFNIDPVVLRIIFFVLFLISGGIVLPVYLLLWIAVPKARTTAQRLEMRGREATVSNIEKSIREEVNDVKDSYKKFKDSESYSRGKDQMSRFGEIVYSVLRVALKIVVILVGALMVLVGFTGLVSFLTSMVVGHSIFESAPFIPWFLPDFHMPGFANYFMSPGSLTILMIASAFIVGIPLLAILFVGTKLIFRYKTNNKLIFLGAFGIWLVSLVIVIIVSVGQIKDYSKRTSVSQSQVVTCNDCQTLYLELGQDNYKDSHRFEIDLDRIRVISEDGEVVMLGHPRLDVEKSSSNDFVIMTRTRSRGRNQEAAKENVEEIVYNFTQKDSVLYFDPYFTLEKGSRWLDQEVDITVRVPEGKRIYLGDDLIKIIYDIENVSNTWGGDMVGRYWKMSNLGLELDTDQ